MRQHLPCLEVSLFSLACAVCCPPAAAGTAAGIVIENIAEVTYDTPGGVVDASSNASTIQVLELIDLRCSNVSASGIAPGAETQFRFALHNAGNAPRQFLIEAEPGDRTPYEILGIQIDPSNDAPSPQAGAPSSGFAQQSPSVAPGDTLVVVVTAKLSVDTLSGSEVSMSLAARPVDGVEGEATPQFATANPDWSLNCATTVTVPETFVTVRKSFADRDGATTLATLAGDTVSYKLEVSAVGAGKVRNLVVTDDLPPGLQYVAGSMLLDGAALSDRRDEDPGAYEAGVVSLMLAERSAPFEHELTFKARASNSESD